MGGLANADFSWPQFPHYGKDRARGHSTTKVVRLKNTAMCLVTTVMHSDKCTVKWFCCCVDTTLWIYEKMAVTLRWCIPVGQQLTWMPPVCDCFYEHCWAQWHWNNAAGVLFIMASQIEHSTCKGSWEFTMEMRQWKPQRLWTELQRVEHFLT
jgi:hypothetical protein